MSCPPAELFPPLDAATEAALRASIERFGVLVPVVQDQHGRVLDGNHRSRIAEELGVKYRVDVVIVADDAEAEEIARTLNTDRRHLSPEQRREVVAALRQDGHSLRAIAGAVGVSKSQVAKDLADCPAVDNPSRVHRQGGGTYPARRPPVVAAKNPKEAELAQAAIRTLDQLPSTPVVDLRRVERLAREQEADRRRQQLAADRVVIHEADIRHGPFWEALADVADGSVDAVITDPPYRMSDNDISTLFAESTRLLRARGALVCMIGQLDMPAYLRHYDGLLLDFRWICAWLTPGPATRIHSARVGTNWKPVLIFERLDTEEEARNQPWLSGDVFRSPAEDKTHHHWGQNLEGFRELVDAFTAPGDLVVDPFLGGGTTAIACRDLGRRFIGCDIDAAAVSVTVERLRG